MRGGTAGLLSGLFAALSVPASAQTNDEAKPAMIVTPPMSDYKLPPATAAPILSTLSRHDDLRLIKDNPAFRSNEQNRIVFRQEFDDGHGSIRIRGKGARIEWHFP